VPPTSTTANIGSGDSEVGAIYAADGTVQTPLAVTDGVHTFNHALIHGLKDAGLMPVALDSNPGDNDSKPPADFILTSELEELKVDKRFEEAQTIHGQYFTMNAKVRIKY
jgi:hypothetical protein